MSTFIEEERIHNLADLYKVFGDSTRIKILCSLLQKEKSVTEIANDLNMNQSAISHQLSILKTNHLVKSKRQGKTIVYSIECDHTMTIINKGIEHLNENYDFKKS